MQLLSVQPAAPPVAEPLLTASPNPFNPTTTIRFRLPESRAVSVALYDVRGERVATLVQGTRPAGEHEVQWMGRTDQGLPASSGVYFVILKSGDLQQRLKVILLK